MTYTQLGLLAIALTLVSDFWILRTRLITREIFWVSYSIILVFQLLTNGALTGFRIVRYSGEAIVGSTIASDVAPPFIGEGRLVFAPIEDLMFGFALVLLTLSMWIWLGRKGIQRLPTAGPPMWRKSD
ncbi:MAG: lycopene cyclase domain-containing protein [Actinomycetota bacterium]|nr:lycopene cyclase domain-containing protein [Actinomycetota bacterium]